MKVIVAGGRHFRGTLKHKKWLIKTLRRLNATILVWGCCEGADAFGYKVAKSIGMKDAKFPADWYDFSEPCFIKIDKRGRKYNALAGFNRNAKMAEFADACILFPGGNGTSDMRKQAQKNNLTIVNYTDNVESSFQ